MRLRWAPAAIKDLKDAVDYIEYDLDSPQAAKRFIDTVQDKANLLSEVPGAGTVLRTVHGVDTGYRYVMCGDWMLFVSCEEDCLLVVRLLYGKSDYLRALFGRER